MLADLASAVAGATDAADLVSRIDAWFDAPGGPFETTGWLGEGEAPRVRLGEGGEAAISVRADAREFRDVLKALALVATVSDPAYAGPAHAVDEVLETGAKRAISAVEAVVGLRAEIGLSEARIEESQAAAQARRAALDVAWNDAVMRDPFEAASAFQALETQIQTAYTVTVRISRLTLADMLRCRRASLDPDRGGAPVARRAARRRRRRRRGNGRRHAAAGGWRPPGASQGSCRVRRRPRQRPGGIRPRRRARRDRRRATQRTLHRGGAGHVARPELLA